MASITMVLKKGLKGIGPRKESEEITSGSGAIKDLISKAFSTRNILHFQHWRTQSYAQHNAVGDLYDDIISTIDNIVECYQGKFGLITGLSTLGVAEPTDIVSHVKAEAQWICDNSCAIANDDDTIENLIQDLLAKYYKTIYKLENLK